MAVPTLRGHHHQFVRLSEVTITPFISRPGGTKTEWAVGPRRALLQGGVSCARGRRGSAEKSRKSIHGFPENTMIASLSKPAKSKCEFGLASGSSVEMRLWTNSIRFWILDWGAAGMVWGRIRRIARTGLLGLNARVPAIVLSAAGVDVVLAIAKLAGVMNTEVSTNPKRTSAAAEFSARLECETLNEAVARQIRNARWACTIPRQDVREPTAVAARVRRGRTRRLGRQEPRCRGSGGASPSRSRENRVRNLSESSVAE
jgi:hypothetical protein